MKPEANNNPACKASALSSSTDKLSNTWSGNLAGVLFFDLGNTFNKKQNTIEVSEQGGIKSEKFNFLQIIKAAQHYFKIMGNDSLYPNALKNKFLLTFADVVYQTLPVLLIAPLASALGSNGSLLSIGILTSGLVTCWLIRSWANRNRELIDETIFRRAWRTCENEFLKKHMSRSLLSQADLGYNDKVTKVKEQGNRLASFTQRSIEITGYLSAASLATLGIMTSLPLAGLAIIGCSTLYLANYYRYATDFNTTEDKISEIRRSYWYKRGHITTPQSVRDLKLLGKEERAITNVDNEDNQLAQPRLIDTKKLVTRNTLPSILSLATNISVLTYAGVQTYFGGMSSEILMQIISLALYTEFQLGLATKAVSLLMQDYAVVREALSIDKQAEPETNPTTKYVHLSPEKAPIIEFKDIGYKSQTGKVILENINLTISPGRVYGFCGKSGAGKTTLIKLLTGELSPTSGKITLNGEDITNIHPADRKKIFRYLAQDYATFESIPIAETIRLGKLDEQNGEAFQNAIKIAQVDFIEGDIEKVVAAPEGLFKNAQPLSLGERQRVAIARTIIANSPVLIMDEPGASLDHDNEDTILEEIILSTRDQTEPKIFILISHRFANLKKADHIYFFTRGEGITEQGTHEKLMNDNNHYAKLAKKEISINAIEKEPEY
jgi:ABC-type multidrug transport system fused ATPase/permease subunit